MVESVQNRIKILPAVQGPSSAPVPLAQLQTRAGLSGRASAFSSLTLYSSDHAEHSPKCAVVFLQSAYQKVVEHLSQDTTREHGGLLLGYESALDSGGPAVVVTDTLPARHTEGTPVRLTFTKDSWREFEEEILRRYPDKERVPQRLGWYHSHPNISIFLSQYDLDVCTTFQRRRYPVALVVDPVQNRGGFFIGDAKGYRAHSPRGFYEAHDQAEESIVTWRNLRKADGAASQADITSPVSTSKSGLKIVPHSPQKSRAIGSREAALGLMLATMAVAIGYLFITERRDDRNIQALSTVLSSLKPGAAAGPVAPQAPTAALTITPLQAEVDPSQQMQFHADITGTADKGIGWERTPKLGTISSTGLYTAPKKIKSETKVTVTARSAADGSVFATALVRLLPPKPVLSVKVTPETTQLKPLQKQQFRARVSGVPQDQDGGVEWTLVPKGQGTVSKDGLYTAPPTIVSKTTVTLTATSLADDSKSAIAKISLVPAAQAPIPPASGSGSGKDAPKSSSPTVPTPSSSTSTSSPPTSSGPLEIKADKTELSEGESVTLTAGVGGKVESDIIWSLDPVDIGSISQDGRYTAPKVIPVDQTKVTVTATSKKDPTRTAKQVLTIKPNQPKTSSVH